MDPYTFKYKDDGVLLNADITDPVSPFVDVTRVEGLSNAPYRTTERDSEGMDGGFVDAEFETIRTIIIEGTAYATVDTIQGYLQSLKANFAPTKTPEPFYLSPPGLNDRVVFCKSYGIKYDWNTALRTGTTDVQIQLMAEDPTIYDVEPVTGSTTLATSGFGRAYNKSYNYGYGGVITGAIITLYNGGDKDTGAEITIFGPITNPSIYHDMSGRQLTFNTTVNTDEFLFVDLRTRSVRLNGTANRRSTLDNTSRWFMLPPGPNSLRLLGSDPISGAPDPAMSVTTRGAYR